MATNDLPNPGQQAPKIIGTSPGGSRLLKYGGAEFNESKIGFTEELNDELFELREKIYSEIFGECDTVLHELMPYVPHIDVYRFPPSSRRNFFTYVTGGMSDQPMASPEELGREYRRVELVFYSAEDRPEYSEILRRLAHFPHDNTTWLHWYHSMPNGSPTRPIFDEGALDSFFFMPSIVPPDSTLEERLSWRDEPVKLVWCVPITTAECQLKLERGSDAIYDLFDQHQHPFIFTGDRASYV